MIPVPLSPVPWLRALLILTLALGGCVSTKGRRAKKDPAATKAAPTQVDAPSKDDPAMDARIGEITKSIVIQATVENLNAIAAEGRLLLLNDAALLPWDGFLKRYEAELVELEAVTREVAAAKTDAEGARLMTQAAGPVSRVEMLNRMVTSHRDGDALALDVYTLTAMKHGSEAASAFFVENLVTGDGISAGVVGNLLPGLRALARKQEPMAHYALATAYLVGRLARKDEKIAFKHASEAARLELPEGQFLLGLFHVKGIGTPKDRAKAKALLQKAAAGGYEEAAEVLAALELQK